LAQLLSFLLFESEEVGISGLSGEEISGERHFERLFGAVVGIDGGELGGSSVSHGSDKGGRLSWKSDCEGGVKSLRRSDAGDGRGKVGGELDM
jgi:hypothetical protein